jgi:hypothetical protein
MPVGKSGEIGEVETDLEEDASGGREPESRSSSSAKRISSICCWKRLSKAGPPWTMDLRRNEGVAPVKMRWISRVGKVWVKR